MTNATQTATHANTYRHHLGTPDYSLSAELEDYAAEQEAEDERLDAEARREINFMLFDGFYG